MTSLTCANVLHAVAMCQVNGRNMMHLSLCRADIWSAMTASLRKILTLWIIQCCLSHDSHTTLWVSKATLKRTQVYLRPSQCTLLHGDCYRQNVFIIFITINWSISWPQDSMIWFFHDLSNLAKLIIQCLIVSFWTNWLAHQLWTSLFSVTKIAAQPWGRRPPPLSPPSRRGNSK